MAAKASIAMGDPQRAGNILNRAVELQSDDVELKFLQRIVARQQRGLTVAGLTR
jgi:hypothetical protein